MPLTPKRPALQADLVGILSDVNNPMNGQKLAKALSKFSMGVLPPTIGIFTGIGPAKLAYDSAGPFDKTKGIENAVNTFAKFNASGMAPFAFTGIAPPPIKNLQRFFDMVRKGNGTVTDIAKFLSIAILVNYTLGRATFNPLSIPIPTWNIGILPGKVRDEMDQSDIDAKKATAQKQQEAKEAVVTFEAGPDGISGTEDDRNQETDSFFEQSNQPY